MRLTGEEIRRRLQVFAARWSVYDRSERAEAQTFLNELFACYGTDRQAVATFEEPQAGRFLDLLWPRVVIFEMKAPGEAKGLERHRAQALDYWRNAADPERNIPAPRFVVLCAFRRLEIWEPGRFPQAPRLVMDLVELPDRYDALLFLVGEEPVFVGAQVELTRDAVAQVISVFSALKDRRAAGPDVLRNFVLQCVWSMFAEDLGMVPEHRFTRLVEGLVASPSRSSADELGGLFRWLNDPASERPQHGAYARVPYANGGLFAEPAFVHLERDELELLRAACGHDWTKVQPQIFGSLLEGGLGHDKQWLLGAHYTAEADIQKVVQPTIVRPWRERIENLTKHSQAKRAQADLMRFVVLDPACGSGNFLYIAYRELRRLEARLRERERELRRKGGIAEQQESLAAFFPVSNLRGLDIDGFAVGLARVVLWMGHKLAVEELDAAEATLPLADLSGIRPGDALTMPWPRADAIIGNPPFHGSQNLRGVLGDDYVEWLRDAFGVGVKDYCVYWFRKAHDHLEPGGRAGLVGTNSISQNRARSASLDYIAETGGVITDAVSTQDWPGEAAVDVSIVNWVKEPPKPPAAFVLDGVEVAGITTSLRALGDGPDGAVRLAANRGRAFQGPIPVGAGFVLADDEARRLLARPEAEYAEVVRPYLVGDDIAGDPGQLPRRWIIDFAAMPLEEAMRYPAALEIVRERVKPDRERNRDRGFREKWWQFGRPRGEMRMAVAALGRFIAANAQGKRILFVWTGAEVCPSNLTNVFAFDGDYSMGVLTSRLHGEWARLQSSTLEDRIRYTPTSAFETFPWPPAPTDEQREAVGALSAEVIRRRQEICAAQDIGLTTLYNQVDDGAWTDVKDLHRRLDEAVVAAYGWPVSVAADTDEAIRRLLELNGQIAAGEVDYDPFTPVAAGAGGG